MVELELAPFQQALGSCLLAQGPGFCSHAAAPQERQSTQVPTPGGRAPVPPQRVASIALSYSSGFSVREKNVGHALRDKVGVC